MRKQKSLNNKGFSLVELIIVIAIMAILVGVLAPQLLKYVEKTRVSSDTQFADTVKTAITTAMLDPSILDDGDAKSEINTLKGKTTALVTLLGKNDPFSAAVKETLGYTDGGQTWINGKLKSTLYAGSDSATAPTNYEVFFSIDGNNVAVAIANTHKSGTDKADEGVIVVGVNGKVTSVSTGNSVIKGADDSTSPE